MLKVLLADDSAAIKKVVQLSLQDYGVEVQTVGNGKDVLDAARNFKPDIAFVDVLLPHRTGYDVTNDLKQDSALANTPVVMLWSSFMAFDENKYKTSGADDRLEKPFEVSNLRALVNKYVPKTQTNPLSKHVEFPKIDLDFAESPVKSSGNTSPGFTMPPAESWSMSSFEDIPPIANEITGAPPPAFGVDDPTNWGNENDWVKKDLGKFRVPIPQDETVEEDTVTFQFNESKIAKSDFMFQQSVEEPAAPVAPVSVAPPQQQQTPQAPRTPPKAPAPTILPQAKAPTPENIPPVPRMPAPPTDVRDFTVVDGGGTTRTEIEKPQFNVEALSKDVADKAIAQLTANLSETIQKEVQAQVREIVEKIVWKIVPDIATNLIKAELDRLIGDKK